MGEKVEKKTGSVAESLQVGGGDPPLSKPNTPNSAPDQRFGGPIPR